MQVTLYRSVVISLLLSVAPALAAGNDWTKFAPETKDFEVEMPASVDSQSKDARGISIRIYKATTGTRNFVISATTVPSDAKSVEGFLDGIKDSIKDEKADIVSSTPATGTGWNGSLIEAQKGESKFCYLVSHANDAPLGYTLVTNGPSNDSQTKEFFESFVVHIPKADPSDQTFGGLVDPKNATADTPFEEGRRFGKIIGLTIPFFVALLVALFVRKLLKRKKYQ